MAINIFNATADTTNNGIGRADSTFSTGEFAVTWQQYLNVDRASKFQTYMQLGGTNFVGTNDYLVCFDGNGYVSHNMALGSDGSDTYGSTTPTVGSWVRMGFRRTINGATWDNRFYYDLPTTASVILKNDSRAVVLNATALWYFGSATWTLGECGNMKFRAIKIFTSDIGETDLSNESGTSNLVNPSLSGNLYGRYPLVSDLLDVSGNARHFSTGVTLAFAGFAGSAGDYTFDGIDPLNSVQAVVVGQANETDLAQALTHGKVKVLGQATETDLAQSITRSATGLSATVNQVTETDLAQAVAVNPRRRLIGQISETDLAQPATHSKVKVLAQATETELAQPITAKKTKDIGQPAETDLSQSLTHRKTKLLGQTTETDLAQPVSVPGQHIVPVNQVNETDLAQPIAWAPKRRLINQVTEGDAAQPLTHKKMRTLGIPVETDLAQALARSKTRSMGQAVETDLAQALKWAPKRRIIGQVFGVDFAQPITVLVGEKLMNVVSVVLHCTQVSQRVLSVTLSTGDVVHVSPLVSRALRT